MSIWNKFIEEIPYFRLYDTIINSECLIKTILNNTTINSKILEIGVGTGINTRTVLEHDRNIYCVDFNKKICKKLKSLDPVNSSAISLPFKNKSFDLIYSQGLIEHFKCIEVIQSLKEQKRVAQKVLFEVPTEKWPLAKTSTFTFGDENFRNIRQWKYLIELSGLQIISIYGWGFLPKYKKYKAILPPFIFKRITPKISNLVGFLCK